MKLKFLIPILVVVMLSACNFDRIYHETHTFDKYNWVKTDTISYEVDINQAQANKDYNLEFNIRYIQGYQYKFLNLNILILCPNGKEFEKVESIQIRKDNAEYIGEGAGSYWDIDHKIEETFKFEQAGKYIINVSPIVEEERLLFVEELGLGVVKSINN